MMNDAEFEKICGLKNSLLADILGFEFLPVQKQHTDNILRSVLFNKGQSIVGEFTRQSGKTTCSVGTFFFLMLFYGVLAPRFSIPNTGEFNIGFFAPQEEQAKTPFMKLRNYFTELQMRTVSGKKWNINFDEFSKEFISYSMDGFRYNAHYFTASPTSHPESKTLHLIYYDEAQDLIDKQVDKAISPMGAMTNATEVWTGVAGYRRCRFHDHVSRLPADQKVLLPMREALVQFSDMYEKTKNPIYLNYKSHIEKKKFEIGDTSDAFKTQYLLQWLLERGQFITYEELELLQDDYALPREFPRVATCYGGLDWGKASSATAFTVVDGECRTVAWFEWHGDDYNTQIEEISELMFTRFQGMRLLHCDSTGTQDQIVDILRARLSGHQTGVLGVSFGATSKDQMFKNLSMLMRPTMSDGKVVREAKFRYPRAEVAHKQKFVRQMVDLQKEIRNEKWRCNAPDGPNYHDDFCDSVALACLAFAAEQRRPSGNRFAIGGF